MSARQSAGMQAGIAEGTSRPRAGAVPRRDPRTQRRTAGIPWSNHTHCVASRCIDTEEQRTFTVRLPFDTEFSRQRIGETGRENPFTFHKPHLPSVGGNKNIKRLLQHTVAGAFVARRGFRLRPLRSAGTVLHGWRFDGISRDEVWTGPDQNSRCRCDDESTFAFIDRTCGFSTAPQAGA